VDPGAGEVRNNHLYLLFLRKKISFESLGNQEALYYLKNVKNG
jgi:hypothetical protein